jgi:hypothetical protein
MNQEDFVGALDDLAGTPPRPTSAARAAVAGRVGRARRRIGAASAVLVVVIGLSGFGIVQSSALDSSPGRTVVAGRGACQRIPSAVPRPKVPEAVRAWSSGRRVVGGGSLWTVRGLLTARRVREGNVLRMKIAWFVVPLRPGTPAPVLTAREIGGAGRATGRADRATNEQGTWFASTIELTGARTCWEITARHGGDVIRFRRSTGRG